MYSRKRWLSPILVKKVSMRILKGDLDQSVGETSGADTEEGRVLYRFGKLFLSLRMMGVGGLIWK
jgi:hypothetical protein